MKKKIEILFSGLLTIITILSCTNKDEHRSYNSVDRSNKSETLRSAETTSPTNWYEGGTLQQSLVCDWKVATYANKLATCADFMATTDNTISMEELKIRSENLVANIDEATRGLESTDDMKISKVAALCVKTMGY